MLLRVASQRLHVAKALHARLGRPARAAFGSGGSVSSEELLYTQGHFATPYVGPVTTQLLPGKSGWGLVATRDVQVGELLLVSSPLAVVQGPSDEMPDIEDLLATLQETQLSQQQRRWLSQMYDGSSSTSSGSVGGSSSTTTRMHPVLPASSSDSSTSSSSSSAAVPVPSDGADAMSEDAVERVVAFNAFGDAYEDLAAASCRGEEAQSHIGLWPHFNLLNHSCFPNTVHYVVGKLMLVRACRAVAAGEELLASYLGRQEFTPAVLRRAVLKERYGFMCQCERCTLETQQLSPDSQALLSAIHAATTRLAPELTTAATDDDEAALERIGGELQALAERLMPLLQSLLGADDSQGGDGGGLSGSPPTSTSEQPALDLPGGLRQGAAAPAAAAAAAADTAAASALLGREAAVLQVQASVYDFLELLYMHAGLTGQDSTAELELCMRVVGAVSPGSELHCFQAAKLLADAVRESQEDGGDGQPTEALVACAVASQDAHRARYGQAAGSATLVKLMQLNTKWSQTFL